MTERNPIRDDMNSALTAAVAAALAGTSGSLLAEDDEDYAVQEKVTVTGSRIQRVDIEGPTPVAVITREEIDASGEINLGDVLNRTTFNSFGSFQPRSGFGAAVGQAAVDLRGLGPNRTLVLLDGRRMANGALEGGSTQNLNVIPFAAVERIEILPDGASAIYGSDAMAGVVNIILRRDYEGVHIGGQIGRPTGSGGDEDSYGFVMGVSSAKGNITFSLDHEEREQITSADRSFTRTGLSSFGFPGTFVVSAPDPGGSGAAAFLGTFPDPRCPGWPDDPGLQNLRTDPDFPNSMFQGGINLFGIPAGFCRFNFAGAGGDLDAGIDRNSAFVNGNYQVTETASIFARAIFTQQDAFGRYAPTPVAGPILSIAADNPLNPTRANVLDGQFNVLPGPLFDADGNVLGIDGCILFPADPGADPTCMPGTPPATQNYTGPFTLNTVAYRNIPGGTRDANVEGTLEDYLVGVEGTTDWFGSTDWELGAQYSKQRNTNTNSGQTFASLLQDSIDNETFDLFGVLDPDGPDPMVAAAAGHEGFEQRLHRVASVDGTINFDALQMSSGPVPVALGFEYRDERYDQNFDAVQNAGLAAGSAGGDDVQGARTVLALFAEVSIPLLSNLELNLAARYDDYNDFGTTVNPKIAAGYRPVESLLLRASYGEGFRAPSMTELYGAIDAGIDFVVDTTRCNATGQQDAPLQQLPGGHPCRGRGFLTLSGANPDLEPETSEALTLGVVWNPLEDLDIALTYYDLEVEDQVSSFSAQAKLDDEFQRNMGGLQGTPSVIRGAAGQIVQILTPVENIAGTRTDGYDIDIGYRFGIRNAGEFSVRAVATIVDTFEQDQANGLGFQRLPGDFDPDYRVNLSLGWQRGDFSATILGYHIDEARNGPEDDPSTVVLDSWTTWDVQFGWQAPWNGRVTAGARNVLDEDPPKSDDFTSIYSNQLHDIFGRVPYVRYEQDL